MAETTSVTTQADKVSTLEDESISMSQETTNSSHNHVASILQEYGNQTVSYGEHKGTVTEALQACPHLQQLGEAALQGVIAAMVTAEARKATEQIEDEDLTKKPNETADMAFSVPVNLKPTVPEVATVTQDRNADILQQEIKPQENAPVEVAEAKPQSLQAAVSEASEAASDHSSVEVKPVIVTSTVTEVTAVPKQEIAEAVQSKTPSNNKETAEAELLPVKEGKDREDIILNDETESTEEYINTVDSEQEDKEKENSEEITLFESAVIAAAELGPEETNYEYADELNGKEGLSYLQHVEKAENMENEALAHEISDNFELPPIFQAERDQNDIEMTAETIEDETGELTNFKEHVTSIVEKAEETVDVSTIEASARKEKPLEEVLAQLAAVELQGEDSKEIHEVIELAQEIVTMAVQLEKKTGKEASTLRQEITVGITRLLAELGYQDPEKALKDFTSQHDLEFLILTLRFLALLNNEDNRQEFLSAVHIRQSSPAKKPLRLHLGRMVIRHTQPSFRRALVATAV